MSSLATVTQHSIGSLSLCHQTTQRNKRLPNQPGGGQTFTLHRWHDTLHGTPKRFHQKLQKLIHEFNKVAGYKSNTQKPTAFLYTNSEATEIEIKELIPSSVAPKPHKMPRNTSNQRGRKSIHWKQQKAYEANCRRHKKNGKRFHAP